MEEEEKSERMNVDNNRDIEASPMAVDRPSGPPLPACLW
jgi:hypothetical protein